jgi:hypothetical protein
MLLNSTCSNFLFDFSGAVTAIGVIVATYSLRNIEWRINLAAKKTIIQNLWWILGYLGLIMLLIARTLCGLNPFWIFFCLLLGLVLIFKHINFSFEKFINEILKVMKKKLMALIFIFALILFFMFYPNSFYYVVATKIFLLNNYFQKFIIKQSNFEMLSIILFILSPISFMLPALSTKNLFKGTNKENLFNLLFSISNSMNTEAFKYGTNILVDNLTLIFEDIKNSSNKDQSALNILEIVLTESDYLNYLVESRIDFLEKFFSLIIKNGINKNLIPFTHEKLFFQLYTNQKSYLYKHLEHTGEGIARNIYRIFNDRRIVENFFPFPDELGIVLMNRVNFDSSKFFEVLSKSSLKSLKTLWSNNIIYHAGVKNLFKIIDFEAKTACWNYPKKRTSPEIDRYISSISDLILSEIPEVFHENFDNLSKENLQRLENEVNNDRTQSNFKELTLTEIWSNSYISFFDSLSRVNNYNFDYRGLVLRKEIFCTLYSDRESYDVLRKIVLSKIWHFIREHNLRGLYGSIVRIYITAIFWQPGRSDPEWLNIEYQNIYKLLYDDLRPKFLNGDLMADGISMEKALLPNIIEFRADEESNGLRGNFYLKFSGNFGEKPTLLIEDLKTTLRGIYGDS